MTKIAILPEPTDGGPAVRHPARADDREPGGRKPLPTDFAELARLYPPQAIHDAVGHGNAMEWVNALLRTRDRSPGQEHYLETLSILVAAYERDHDGIDLSDLTGLDSLRFVMEENEMTAAGLAEIVGVDEPTAALVLSGQRPVTAADAAALGRRFGVDAGLFL